MIENDIKKRIEKYKDELKHLYDIQSEIKRLENIKSDLWYEMENVKGIDYSKERGSYNQSAIEQRRLAMIEKMSLLEKLIETEEKKEEAIGIVLLQMSEKERELCIEVIADRRKYKDVCNERNISNTSTLFSMINKIIEKALKKVG